MPSRYGPRVCRLLPSLVLLHLVLSAHVLADAGRQFRHWKALRDHDVVRQERDFSCGLAALATLLTYYFERPVSERQLLDRLELPGPAALQGMAEAGSLQPHQRERLRVLREQGVSLAILADLARQLGLRAQGVSIRPDALPRLSMPAIAYVEPGGEPHFTLIRGVDDRGYVQVADPSWGNRGFTGAQFARIFAPGSAAAGRLLLLFPRDGGAGRADWFGIDRAAPLLQRFTVP